MSTTVFVGNLAWSTTAENLKAIMETAARVVAVEVQTHSDTGRSKGWALVTFESPEGVARAMELLSGRDVEGRPLYIREDRTEVEKEEGFVVFVGNLPWEMTADGLRQVFHEYNPYDVHIKTNMSGRSRGFGLLRFRSSEEAQRSIEQMHGSTVKDRKILVRLDRVHLEAMGKSPATMEISDAVTCGNIPWHTGDDVLACHMAQGGRLVSCQIQRHADTLRSKGWAIIRYLTPEEGANAVRSLHRTVLDGRTLNVRFYKPNKAASDDATNLYPPAYAVAPLGGEHNPPRRPPHQNGNGNGHMPPMQNGGGQPMMGGYNMHYVQQQHHHLVQQQQMGMGFPQGLRN